MCASTRRWHSGRVDVHRPAPTTLAAKAHDTRTGRIGGTREEPPSAATCSDPRPQGLSPTSATDRTRRSDLPDNSDLPDPATLTEPGEAPSVQRSPCAGDDDVVLETRRRPEARDARWWRCGSTPLSAGPKPKARNGSWKSLQVDWSPRSLTTRGSQPCPEDLRTVPLGVGSVLQVVISRRRWRGVRSLLAVGGLLGRRCDRRRRRTACAAPGSRVR